MARLVKLSVVVPEDIDFEMPDGTVYRAPSVSPTSLDGSTR